MTTLIESVVEISGKCESKRSVAFTVKYSMNQHRCYSCHMNDFFQVLVRCWLGINNPPRLLFLFVSLCSASYETTKIGK